MDHLSCRILAHITSHFNNQCCKSWSAQAWKLLGNVHAPKSASVQACIQLQCTRSAQACTRAVHKLGTGLGACVHFQAVSKFGHSNFYCSDMIGVGLQLLCTQISNNLYSSLAQESHRREFTFPPWQLYFTKRS